jgi:hypothetical protein
LITLREVRHAACPTKRDQARAGAGRVTDVRSADQAVNPRHRIPVEVVIAAAPGLSRGLRTGAGFRVELGNEPMEGVGELGFVLIGVRADELNHLAIAVGGLLILTAGFIDHPQPIVAVVHIGEAHQEFASGALSFIEPTFAHERDDGVGAFRELVLVLHESEGLLFFLFASRSRLSSCGGSTSELRMLGCLLLGQAAVFVLFPATTRAWIVASCLGHRVGVGYGKSITYFSRKESREMYASAFGSLNDVRLQSILLKLDRKEAEHTRAKGCPDCQGALHAAPFRRKPRGAKVSEDFRVRYSYCCAKDKCRHRMTPASLRFLGPKHYLAAAVVLSTAMSCGATPARVQRLKELVGVSRLTVLRWMSWWQEVLPATPLWRARCGALRTPVQLTELPQSLLEQFSGCVLARVRALLRFLAPLTAGRRSALPM